MINLKFKDIDINVWKNKQIKLSEMLFFIAFFIILVYSTLTTTMFTVYISTNVARLIKIITIGLIMIKVIFYDWHSKKEKISMLIIFGTLIIAGLVSGYGDLILLAILIIGAKGVSFKGMVKLYFYTILTITIISMISAKLGIIEHIIYYRNDRARYSFGSIYCTDFAAHIFYMILSFCYLKESKISYLNILIFFLLGCFIAYYNGARLDSICIFFICIFLIYLKIEQKINQGKDFNLNTILKIFLIFSVPLSAILSIVTTYIYNPSSPILNKLNIILSNRLSNGKKGIIDYGFTLFGQEVTMVGNGGTNIIPDNYFFIDSSYLSIALKNGLVVLIVLCVYFTILNINLIKRNNIVIVSIIAIIALNSIIAHHFTNISYNVFILCLFAMIEQDKSIDKNSFF